MYLRGNLAEMMSSGFMKICSCVHNKFVAIQEKDRNFTDYITLRSKDRLHL